MCDTESSDGCTKVEKLMCSIIRMWFGAENPPLYYDIRKMQKICNHKNE